MTIGTVDLFNVGGGWHIIRELEPGRAVALCGFTGTDGIGRAVGVENEIDERVVRYKNRSVCANCRSLHDRKEVGDMPAKTTTRKSSTTRKRAASNGTPVDAKRRKEILREAEQIAKAAGGRIDGLTGAKKDEAFRLGKQIAADKHKIVHSDAKVDAGLIEAMLKRLRDRAEKRTKIRDQATAKSTEAAAKK